MSRFPGNIIKLPNVTPTQSSAQGVWSLKDQLVYQRNNQWPFQRDPYFNYTTLLLQGNVPNTTGPQAMTQPLAYNSDASTNNFLVTPNGDVSPRPFSPYFGGAYSNYLPTTSERLTTSASNSGFSFGTGDFTIEGWVYPTATSEFMLFQMSTASTGYTPSFTNTIAAYVGAASKFEIYANNANNTATNAVFSSSNINQWHHFAIVRSSGITKVYFDGALIAGLNNISDPTNYSMTYCVIGTVYDNSYSLKGYLSNLRVVKGRAVYTTNFTPPTSPLGPTSGGANPPQGSECVFLTAQSNRFIDSSGNNIGLNISGSPKVTDNSPFVSTDFTTGAGYFDGTGDYLFTPTNAAFAFGTGDISVEFWYYHVSRASTDTIFALPPVENINIYILTSGVLGYYNGSTSTNSSQTVPLNAWGHIAWVRSSGTVKMYYNGVEVLSHSNTTNFTTNAQVYLGSNPGLTDPSNGYIADVRVLKGTAVYTGAFAPPINLLRTSGATSAASYPSTTNVNTSFAESATSLLTLQTRAASQNIGFIDSSPNEFIVTKNGNTTQGTFSPFSPTGWGNYFAGPTNYFSFSSSLFALGTDGFTIDGWIYLTAYSYSAIFSTWLSAFSSNNGIMLGTNSSGNLELNIGNAAGGGSQNVVSASVIPLNTWVFIQGTKAAGSGGVMKIYINGNDVTPSTVTTTRSVNLTSGVVGRYYVDSSAHGINGYISNVRVSNTVRSSTVPTAPFSVDANTVFLSCQANRFRDAGPGNVSLTVNGTPSVQAFSPFAPATQSSPLVTGGSGYFDGTGSGTAADYLSVLSNTALQISNIAFTIDYWIYPTGTPGASGATIIAKNTTTYPAGYEFNFVLENNRTISFNTYTTAQVTLTSVSALPLNAWAHVAISRSGSTYALYINGVREDLDTNADSTQVTSSNVYIGESGGTGRIYTGYISALRLVKGTAVYDPTQTNIPIPTAPPTAIPNTSLLLNFTNGAAVDATGKNVVESVGTAQLSTRVTKFAGTGSGYFDASVAYQTIPNTAGLIALPGDFTLELWAYRLDATNNTYFCVFGNQAAGNNGFLFWVTGGSANAIRFYSNGAFVMSGANNAVPLNQWTHIALVRSGTATNNMRCYIDGVEDTAARATNTTAFVGVSGNGLAIGTEYSGSFSGTRAAFYYSNYRLTKYARYTANFNTNLPTGPFPIG